LPVGLAATVGYFALPKGGFAQAGVFLSLLLVAAALLVWRIARRDAAEPGPWWMLAAGLAVYTVASALWYLVPVGFGVAVPFPSAVDALFFLSYTLFGGFLVGVVHARQRRDDVDERRLALIDATIMAVAAGTLLWQFLIGPIFGRLEVTLLERVVAAGYPVYAALLFGVVARLLVRGFRRSVPDVLLVVWIGGELAGNVLYGVTSALGTFAFGHPMFLGWLISYTALAGLALHPGLWNVTDPEAKEDADRVRHLWPVVLAAAVPLVVALFESGSEVRGYVAAAALSLCLVLVRTRMLSVDLAAQRRLAADLQLASNELRHRALHDSLTGLGNRALLMDRLGHALTRRPPRPAVVTGLFLLDLDGFKGVNDTLGHAMGDLLLVAVAARLSGCVRPEDTVARLGGDEFAVILGDVDTEEALRLGKRILEQFRDPVDVDGRSLPARASLGIYMADPGCEPGTALRKADLAMYAAKNAGGDRYELFDADLHAEHIARHEMELALTGVASRGELRLHYQPVVDLASGRVCGAEALVRWEHPERGFLYPGAFIEIAEQSGAIAAIGRWVLEESCRQLARWEADGPLPEGFHVAVNLSRRELLEPNIAADVIAAVKDGGCTADQIIIEVTETALMADTEGLTTRLEELREHGFVIAMDDFGTGYSSLDQLRRLPIDVLKIDRAFVEGITQGREDFALATAIVKLATSLGYRSLAEGVETAGQLAHLRALRVEQAQGYLFARPGPPEEIQRLLADPVSLEG
jgi:diguanylate cyclase (GGDEF)-like protein